MVPNLRGESVLSLFLSVSTSIYTLPNDINVKKNTSYKSFRDHRQFLDLQLYKKTVIAILKMPFIENLKQL